MTAAPTVVLLALVGGTLASHACHELLDDGSVLVKVPSVDRSLAIILEMTFEVYFILVFLVLEITVEAIGLRISLGRNIIVCGLGDLNICNCSGRGH